jgi:hypothetical protein
LGRSASLRFLSPLIEPDVPISGIRLSDWLHRKAHGGRPLQAGVSRRHHGTDQPSPYGRVPSEAFGYFQVLPGSSPITDPWLLRKRTRSQGPFLRRHYPASQVVRPCPTPARPTADCGVGGATSDRNGPPPITRITFPTCRAHYPGGSERVHLSVASSLHAAFPNRQAGRHPQLHFRGLLRLHSRYGPLDRSAA